MFALTSEIINTHLNENKMYIIYSYKAKIYYKKSRIKSSLNTTYCSLKRNFKGQKYIRYSHPIKIIVQSLLKYRNVF